jgi:hypothetical protein
MDPKYTLSSRNTPFVLNVLLSSLWIFSEEVIMCYENRVRSGRPVVVPVTGHRSPFTVTQLVSSSNVGD